MTISELLKTYNETLKALHEAFGYVENWRVFPVEDYSDEHWMICEEQLVRSSAPFTHATIEEGTEIYTGVIYTQRHLSKHVYRAETHTMALVDTRCDGNILLFVLDNTKECLDPALVEAFAESEWA